MNFIKLCTQSTHPLVHKALERGGWELHPHEQYWWHEDSGTAPREAEPQHVSAVAWELLRIYLGSRTTITESDRLLLTLDDKALKAALLRAVEALEVEGA